MIERVQRGEVPRKHHIALRSSDGALRWEHCITRAGFEAAYTIAYHAARPHAQRAFATERGHEVPRVEGAAPPLRKRHYRSQDLPARGGAPLDARHALLHSDEITISLCTPTVPDDVYYLNGDADELLFASQGRGVVRSLLGDVPFGPEDYVFLPKGILYRIIPEAGVEQRWLSIECQDLHLPRQWRNEVGQLRMDAPYCHRDFRLPTLRGPLDEGIRDVVVKRQGRFDGLRYEDSPLDVVGWDGAVYPWAFAILDFQPRAGLVHLPPTWHGTFACKGGLVCSFVPRLVDFHPESIPCPYPHSSVDIDEVLFYQRGNFTSRRGVGSGSVSFHPAGIPHGPHPGAYEASMGESRTDELAVMLDVARPLRATRVAQGIEDAAYHDSFL